MQQFKNYFTQPTQLANLSDSSNSEDNKKHHLSQNTKMMCKTLTTDFGSINFDILIGYSNQSLVFLYKSTLFCYDVDKSLLNSIELFENLNRIISDQIIISNKLFKTNAKLQNSDEASNPDKVQKKIFDLNINSGETIGSIKIYFFENINTYLLITNNCAFHFNEIVGYNILSTGIKIICLYKLHVVEFNLDAIFLNCSKLNDFFDSLLLSK